MRLLKQRAWYYKLWSLEGKTRSKVCHIRKGKEELKGFFQCCVYSSAVILNQVFFTNLEK